MSEESVLIPGPTGISNRVRNVLSRPQITHTSSEYREGFRELLELTSYVFASNKGKPYVITGSGTIGMEAAVVSLIEPNDRVLVIDTGYFGRRFVDINKIHRAEVDVLEFPFGHHADPAQVEEKLSSDNYKALFMTHVDTSCGILNPIKDLVAAAQRCGVYNVVDSVAGLGGCELMFDEWGIDIAFTASQKAIAAPPGATLLMVSEKALEAFQNRKTPIQSYYLDLLRWKQVMDDPRVYVATPASQLIMAVKEALQEVKEEGLQLRWRRHQLIADSIREGIQIMDMDLVSERGYRSNTVTGFYVPIGKAIEMQSMISQLFRIQVALGLSQYRDRMLRVGHFGNVSPKDAVSLLSALVVSLRATGLDLTFGRSIEVALSYLEKLKKE